MSTATLILVGNILHDPEGGDFAEEDVDNRFSTIHDVPMAHRRFCSKCFPDREASLPENTDTPGDTGPDAGTVAGTVLPESNPRTEEKAAKATKAN